MRTTQQFSVTPPIEMANLVKTKVAGGEYASESEVIRDGLRVLMARDRAVENWLAQEVVPTYDTPVFAPDCRLQRQHGVCAQKGRS